MRIEEHGRNLVAGGRIDVAASGSHVRDGAVDANALRA